LHLPISSANRDFFGTIASRLFDSELYKYCYLEINISYYLKRFNHVSSTTPEMQGRQQTCQLTQAKQLGGSQLNLKPA